MAKNKGRSTIQDDETIDQDEVIYEEETGSKGGTASTAPKSFVEKYRNLLLVGGVAVVAIGGYFAYQWSQKDKVNEEAQAAMIPALIYYEQDSMAKAINGDGGNSDGLISIVEDFGSTDAGNLARYFLGTAYLKTANLEDGIATLEDYKKGNSMVSAAAYGALGYAYEQKGEFDEAAKNYEEAAHSPEDNMYSTPFYLMHAARNLESANKAEEALKLYQEIKQKYPQSDQGRDGSVDRYIAKLSPEDFE